MKKHMIYLILTLIGLTTISFPGQTEALKVKIEPSLIFQSEHKHPPRPVYHPPHYEVYREFDPYEGYYDIYEYHPGQVEYVRPPRPVRNHHRADFQLKFKFK